MAKQLNIRSDEAFHLATMLSKQTGRSKGDVVLAALLSYSEAKTGRRLTPEQRAFVDELRALALKSAAAAEGKLTSDLSHLYDERGLPK